MSIRTTLTLDDDVYERVKRASVASGQPFRATVNELLRVGLLQRRTKSPVQFKVHARPLGLRRGIQLDDIEALNRLVEGEYFVEGELVEGTAPR